MFLMATNIQSGWLFVLSSLLLGATAGGALVPMSMVRGLHVSRGAPPEAFVGDQVPVDLVIENRSKGTRLSVVVRDPHIAPATTFIQAIRPGERVTVRTARLAARRGVVDGGPVEVASSAPFGIAEAKRTIESSGRTVIFPRVIPLPRMPFLEGAAVQPSLLGPGAQRGHGQDFLGVREYRYGDSPRDVHWPSTARRGTLVVKEMELERPASLVILVDTWADGGSDETALDLCCTVAASVAVKALATGHDVLLAAAQEGDARPPARMGRQEALTWLAGLAAPGGLTLPAVIERTAAEVSGTAALVVLPTWHPNTATALRRPMARLASGGMPVVAVMVDATTFDPRAATLGAAEVIDLERALASVGVKVRRVRSMDDVAPGLGWGGEAVTLQTPAWGTAP
jgi:uncharacterized protein (DUF58 family)